MKKALTILNVIIILIMMLTIKVKAINETFDIKLKVENNKSDEQYSMYILLPKEYIEYAIMQDELDLEIEDDLGNMLFYEQIPSISIKKENIYNDYVDGDQKYAQILVEPNDDGEFIFSILEDYGKLDIKFRIMSDSKNYIIHIDNFKIEDGICEAILNYDNDTIKQPDRMVISPALLMLIVILIVVIIVGIISYAKQK